MKTTIKIRNPSASACAITLEPWGGQYDVPVDGELDLVVEGLGETGLELEMTGDGVTIVATGVGVELTMRRDGKQVRAT